MEKLRLSLGAGWAEIEKTKARLDRIRAKLKRLDVMTFRENKVSGRENHLFLVSSSDFMGDPDRYEKDLDRFLAQAQKRNPGSSKIRLGYLGVPPIYSDFYEIVESLGARVVFNEVQRQFSMPAYKNDLVDQYMEYTYPYDFKGRLADIGRAISERRLHGLIHYAQTFCYRQIYDIMLRENPAIPILTVEGDRPGETDSRTLLRIETFVEMLTGRLNLFG
jgi:benzoyl-CoA reductase/2-hydroxyglutaryl-CoA dehydratase subunit BcrC/BadD/HgdB